MNGKHRTPLFWLITLISPGIILIVTEITLRWIGVAGDSDLTSVREFNGKKYYTVNRSFARRYFPLQSIQPPFVYDETFEVVKSPTTYRIFLLGESTMQGFPYEYNGAIHGLLEDRLKHLFPERNIEIINLGITAVNSYAVLDLMKEVVDYQPDLIILYLGHNEFYGSFGIGSMEFIGKHRSFINFYLELQHVKIVQLLQKIIGLIRSLIHKDDTPPGSTLMEAMAREQTIVYHSPLYDIARENFERNLLAIAEIAFSRNVPLMLSTIVSNLRDQPPFDSRFSDATENDTRTQYSGFVTKGDQFREEQKLREALTEYKKAMQIDSARADLQYSMAICCEGTGDVSEAKRHFSLARDFDVLRFRATAEFNQIIKDVAQTKQLMLADIAGVFEAHSQNGIVDRSLMLEHVHPNLDGYFLIAKEYTEVMREHDCIRPQHEWGQQLSDDKYKARSMMTLFDFEVSFLRIDNLLHHWPFSEPESTRYSPADEEGQLAARYLQGKIDWEHAHYQLAELYKSGNRFVDAQHEYLAIAKIQRFDVTPLLLAGDMSLTMKNYQEADSMYRVALQRDDNQYVNVRLGAMFSEEGIPDSAIHYYQTAIDRDRKANSKLKQEWKLEIMQHLAEEYKKRGDLISARDEISHILSLNPSYTQARRLLDILNSSGN